MGRFWNSLTRTIHLLAQFDSLLRVEFSPDGREFSKGDVASVLPSRGTVGQRTALSDIATGTGW